MRRNPGVDVARGLAVLLMIETHAYDGWVSAQGKATFGYHLSRVLSGIPAALFLLLAGVGLALSAHAQAARGRGTLPGALRKKLTLRGLEILGYGYLVSLAYALIEGPLRPAELLRADILHCIGLSLVLCALLLVERSRPFLRAALLGAGAVALGLLGHRLLHGAHLPRVAAVPLALLVDVAPYTRFPLFPLVAFTALGVATGYALSRFQPSRRQALLGLVLFTALAVLFTHATTWTVAHLGGTLSRGHPAVVFNLLNQSARALAVLSLSMAAPPGALPHLVRLGQGSLLAYAFHIPLCYGRLARPLAHRLDMPRATLAVIALSLLTYGVVRLRDHLRALRHRSSPAR